MYKRFLDVTNPGPSVDDGSLESTVKERQLWHKSAVAPTDAAGISGLVDTNMQDRDANSTKEKRHSLGREAKSLPYNATLESDLRYIFGYDLLHPVYLHNKQNNGNKGYHRPPQKESINGNSKVNEFFPGGFLNTGSRATTSENPPTCKVLKGNESIINNNSRGSNGLDSTGRVDSEPSFKIVAITTIPRKLSVPALLNQVYGGPLEKVELIRKHGYQYFNDERVYRLGESIDWDGISIFLHFNKHEDARAFYHYSKTGLFRVNDIYLNTVVIPDDGGTSEVEEDRNANSVVSELMQGDEKARRVLVLKKPVSNKKSSYSRRRLGYLDPLSNYTHNFDLDEIKRDFGEYGRLVEVSPIVSRKLCFGVQYYDVRSAVRVKRLLQSNLDKTTVGVRDDGRHGLKKDVELKRKYNGWFVWYGRDPSDRSVPV